jgi:hypothetical protein
MPMPVNDIGLTGELGALAVIDKETVALGPAGSGGYLTAVTRRPRGDIITGSAGSSRRLKPLDGNPDPTGFDLLKPDK